MATSIASAALCALAADAAAQAAYRNVSAGGPLRHGVYGRIEVRGDAPPPVIFKQPVRANPTYEQEKGEPIYLYVPPGQVRKWKQHCAKWKACDRPVFFVRMEDSPSRWGRWRELRDQVAFEQDD